MKTLTSALKVSTYVITSFSARPIRFASNTNNNVCLDLQKWRYSIFIYQWIILKNISKISYIGNLYIHVVRFIQDSVLFNSSVLTGFTVYIDHEIKFLPLWERSVYRLAKLFNTSDTNVIECSIIQLANIMIPKRSSICYSITKW